jgi:uncharacterized protein YprB with RNaseH-like and TPR domain
VNEGDVRSRLSRLLGPGPEVDPLRERLRTRRKRAAAACAPPAGLEPDLSGAVLARTTDLDARSLHGRFALEEIGSADPRAVAWLARDPSLAAFDLSRALFLDTETSGLSGGAGTWVFLVGLGSFEADGEDRRRFRVWQGFLSEPAGESALLVEVARRIRSAGAVVSFFGKSFDRHRLEDKMRIHGIEPPFAGRPHLDLYPPLRRLYRPRAGGGLDDARLRTFESALCGVEREDDLPGAMAPAAWFDFLHGRPHDLEGVFRHNRDDVLSLVTLAAHLGRTLHESRAGGEELPGPPAVRAREVAKALVLAREPGLSLPWFDRAAGRGDGKLPEDCARLLVRARRALRKLEKEEGPGRAGALSESEGDPRSQLQCGTDPRPLL